jgi:pyruvate kinase
MCLAWGVRPIAMTGPPASDDDAMREAVRAARQCGLVQKDELIAVVFASPGKRAGATDTVRIVRA